MTFDEHMIEINAAKWVPAESIRAGDCVPLRDRWVTVESVKPLMGGVRIRCGEYGVVDKKDGWPVLVRRAKP